jgi:hypothetical protein
MKQLIALIFLLLMVASVAGYGEYADTATKSDGLEVKHAGWFSGLFEIGTYKGDAFSVDYFLDEKVNLKFDETSWNTKCNGAKFVVEVYNANGFKNAVYSWIGPVSGNQNFAATYANYPLSQPTGDWTFVDYIYCTDTSALISKTNKITISVTEKSSQKTCDAGYKGDKVCSNGDVKQTYQNADCTTVLKTKDDCSATEHCLVGKCEGPECTKDSDCEDWQECKSEGCTAKPEGTDMTGEDDTSDKDSDDTSDDEEDNSASIPWVFISIGLLVVFGLGFIFVAVSKK